MHLSAGLTGRVLVVCLMSGALTGMLVGAGQDTPRQDPQTARPPVFRGAANLVYVDVYPRRDGRFLDGLRPQDFQVFEDGKPQKVETFELIRFPEAVPGAFVRDPSSQAEGDQLAADPRNRVFVIYLDLYHVEPRGGVLTGPPLVEFLRQFIGPADLFTVLTPLQYVSAFVFSRRIDTIESELRSNVYWGQDRPGMLMHTPHEEFLQTCLPRSLDNPKFRQDFGDILGRIHREDLLMTSLENLVRRLGALKDERKNVLFISEGWVPQGARPELLKEINVLFPRISVGPDGRLGVGDRAGSRDVSACDREIGRLASIDFRQRFQNLLTDASLANVSFYPIDVGGLSRTTASGPIETLRMMAANTDGRAILQLDPTNLTPGFRQIAEDLQAYYLLGYYSTNTALDGKFRKIEVRVPQPGVSLTARRGYLAPTEEMRRVAEAAAAKTSAAASAIPAPVTEALAELVRLRPEATMHAQAARTAAGLRVTVELTSRELTSGRWTKGGEVEVALVQPGREPVAATGTLPAGGRSAVVTVPIDAADAGPWRIRSAMMSGSHRLEQTLDVKPPVAGPVGDATWWRGAGAASAPFRPAAERLFRRTERLRVEWPATAALESRVARLLDRRGESLGVGATVTEFERDGQRIVAADVVLAPLADGDYLLELAAGQGGATVRRLVAFRVTR